MYRYHQFDTGQHFPPVAERGNVSGVRHDVHDLYDGCYRRLVAQTFALTLDLPEAHDCVQEAFARALASPRSFRASDDPQRWLRTAALRVARRRMRWRAVQRRVARQPGTPAGDAEQFTLSENALIDALRRLPTSLREPVALYHVAGLDVGEIATLLDVADATVHGRIDQGRDQLQRHLDTVGRAGGA